MSASTATPSVVIPHIYRSTGVSDGPPLPLGHAETIAVAPGLAELAHAFIDGIAGDAGVSLTLLPGWHPEGITPLITAELISELASDLPPTQGLSPHDASSHPDERYRLRITTGIQLSATTVHGIAAGFATLRQIVATAPCSANGTRMLDRVEIVDGPRYAWRGFKLDVARHYYPVDAITHVIDQLSRYKVNALSLHLVDNEGWRIEVPGYPELTADGHDYYTLDDLATIAEFARQRAIAVIPEIDFPGHCAALVSKHPDFGVLTRKEGHDIAYVDPSVPQLWDFLRVTYEHVLTATASAYLHVGGDEAFGMPADMFTDFVQKAHALVADLGAEPICYQEASRATLPSGSVTQYWLDFAGPGGLIDQLEAQAARGEELPFGMKPAAFPFYREGQVDLERASQQQLQVIVSPTQHAYFDTPFAEPSADAAQEKVRATLGMPVYAPQNLNAFSEWDPAEAFVGLDPSRIAGVEAALWSDTVQDTSTMQVLLLPRLPGFAECAWSHEPRSWDEYRTVLAQHASSWRARGLASFESSLVDWQ